MDETYNIETRGAARDAVDSTSIFISRDYFTFSSAHFAQLPDGTSELLHGHNYTVRAEVEGDVDALGYVMDFTPLKAEIRAITAEMNQKTILAATSELAPLTVSDGRVSVTVGGLNYVLPVEATCILPLSNTTCEALAGYIGRRLAAHLPNLTLAVTVEECPGQGSTWRRTYRPVGC